MRSAWLLMVLAAAPARAANTLSIVDLKVDRPTVIALGVQVLIAGDDNHDAKVTVRWRRADGSAWHDGMPLFRVHPEVVAGRTVPEQFAGSVLDLAPATAYVIELHAVDPDGFDQTMTVDATTRPVPPSLPATPHVVPVSDAPSLVKALAAAQAGDVITLADGTYAGAFALHASGTAAQPIVIRGAAAGAVLDGQGCPACNVLEVYGSFVHVENLTLQNANRALRFQTIGAEADVVRYVHIRDVTMAIAANQDQRDFYVCDNTVEGRLQWPATYADDGGAHASDEGIVVTGSGHVVCHNRVSGFGDALNNDWPGARANDFYGNEVLFTYDDGLELDEMEGNGRAFRNRFLNTYDTISFQPIFGGPVYVFRNVVGNVANEQLKLHALGGNPPEEPSGVLIYNNTFVRPYHAMQVSTSNVVRYYELKNNLFVGPAVPNNGIVVNWDTPIDFSTGTVDYNAYFPDGTFHFGYGQTGANYADFAAVAAGGRYEAHGLLVGAGVFNGGLLAPIDHHPLLASCDVTLDPAAPAIDRGVVIPNVTDDFRGAAPDVGAFELGCVVPIYGPRPPGMDERNEPMGCVSSAGVDGGAPPPEGDMAQEPPVDRIPESGGCGCSVGARPTTGLLGLGLGLGLALGILWKRRR